jgi:hypothetical protein
MKGSYPLLAKLLGQACCCLFASVALVSHEDLRHGNLVNYYSLALHVDNDTFQAGAESDSGRGRPTERLYQAVVPPSSTDGTL